MSTAFLRAMGYGMEWHAFESECLFDCQAHETWDTLHALFETLTDEDLTVDVEAYEEAWKGLNTPSIIEKRLLSKNFTDGGRRPAVIADASSLLCFVHEIDDTDPTHVIFFPSAAYSKNWRRRNDDIDMTFERWRDGDDRFYDPAARSFVKTVPYGHYPWTNFLMLEDGTPEQWLNFRELQKRPDIVPAVPAEIRWYLKKHGVLSDEGVNKLRPMLAQWWS